MIVDKSKRGNPRVVSRVQYEQESEEVFKLWARLAHTKVPVVQKYYEMWYEVIVRELYTGGSVYIPKMGWMFLQEQKNTAQKKMLPDGTYQYYEVPARDLPVFRPEDDFISDVNMKGITSMWRYRQRVGKPSWRDKEREKRAAEMLELDYQPVDTIPITPSIKTLIHQSKFKQQLQEMRKKYEEKLCSSINEVREIEQTKE